MFEVIDDHGVILCAFCLFSDDVILSSYNQQFDNDLASQIHFHKIVSRRSG